MREAVLGGGGEQVTRYINDSREYSVKSSVEKLEECRATLQAGLTKISEVQITTDAGLINDAMKIVYKEALRLSHEIAQAHQYNPQLELVVGLDAQLTADVRAIAQNANNINILGQWNSNLSSSILTGLKREFQASYKPALQAAPAAPAVVVHAAPPQPVVRVAPPPPAQGQPGQLPQSQVAQQPLQPAAPTQPQVAASAQPQGQPAAPAQPQEQPAAPAAETPKDKYGRLLNQLSSEIEAHGLGAADHYNDIVKVYGEIKAHLVAHPIDGATEEAVKQSIFKVTKDKVELEIKIRRELFNETPEQVADAVADRVYSKLEKFIRDNNTREFIKLFDNCSQELQTQLLSDKGKTQNLFKPAMLRGNKEIYEHLKAKTEPAAFIFDSTASGSGKWEFVDGQEVPLGDREYFAAEIGRLVSISSKEDINKRCLLNIAAYFGATQAVELAINKGADPSIKGSRFSNALNIAGNLAITPTKDLSFKRGAFGLIADKCFDLIENGAIEDRTKYRNAIADSGVFRYLYDDGSLRDFAKFLKLAKSHNVPLTIRQPVPDLRSGQVLEPREGKLLEGPLLEQEITAWFSPFQMSGGSAEKNKLALEKFKLLVDAGIIDFRAIDRLQPKEKDRVKFAIDGAIRNNPEGVKALTYAQNVALVEEEADRAKESGKSTDNLRTKHVAEPEKQLAETQEKWLATLKTPAPTQQLTDKEREELERNKLKSAALKRMMLFYGCSGLAIEGHSLNAADSVTAAASKPAQENNLPVGAYFSGHMGRCYVDLEGGPSSDEVLKYITTGNRASSDGIHLDRHLMAKNREKELTGSQIVFDRHSATHAGIKKGSKYKEDKGIGYGAKGALEGVAYKISSPFRSKQWKETHHTKHMGMNIAAGGLGGSHYSTSEAIKGSGEDGHMYFNTGTKSFGAGLEATAPGTTGPLGAHSKTGGADEFTAFEGAKYAIAKKNKGHLKALFEAQIKLKLPNPKLLSDLGSVGLAVDENGNITDTKAFNKFVKKDERINGVCGLLGLKTYHRGSLHVITPFGSWLMEQGITIQNNYSGALGKVDSVRFDAIVDEFAKKEIPDEIVYFKPRNDVKEFAAQEAIYKNIDEKPLLKAHPELSYEASNMIGNIYNALPDAQAKATLTLLEEYMKDPKFSREKLHNIAVVNQGFIGIQEALEQELKDKAEAERNKAMAERDAPASAVEVGADKLQYDKLTEALKVELDKGDKASTEIIGKLYYDILDIAGVDQAKLQVYVLSLLKDKQYEKLIREQVFLEPTAEDIEQVQRTSRIKADAAQRVAAKAAAAAATPHAPATAVVKPTVALAVAKPSTPSTVAPNPVAKPSAPSTVVPKPVAKPSAPSAVVPKPVAKPSAPPAVVPKPVAKPSAPSVAASKPSGASKKTDEEKKPMSKINKLALFGGFVGAIGASSVAAWCVCLVVAIFVPGAQVALPILFGVAAVGIAGCLAIESVTAVLKIGDLAIEGIKKATSSPVKPEPVVAPTPPITPQRTPPPPALPPLSPSATPAKPSSPTSLSR